MEDKSKRTRRANQTWKLREQIAECIGGSQRVNPAYTFDTEVDCSSSSTSCNGDRGKSSEVNSDDSDCRGKRSKTLKNDRRKRKSYSSAAEMLSFLQSQGGFPLSRNFYVRTDVNFNWLYVRKKIEMIYESSRVNVKVEPCSTFTFTRELSYIVSILFTYVKPFSIQISA